MHYICTYYTQVRYARAVCALLALAATRFVWPSYAAACLVCMYFVSVLACRCAVRWTVYVQAFFATNRSASRRRCSLADRTHKTVGHQSSDRAHASVVRSVRLLSFHHPGRQIRVVFWVFHAQISSFKTSTTEKKNTRWLVDITNMHRDSIVEQIKWTTDSDY